MTTIAKATRGLPGPGFQQIPVQAGFRDAQGDAFGRLRVSQPETLFDAKQVFDNAPLLFTEDSSGATITYNNARASTSLSTDVNNGSYAIRQSKQYVSYQPGKSQLIFATFCFTDGQETDVTKRVGYFDVDNGIFFEADGTDIRMVRRSNVSGAPLDEQVNQADWNIDKLDGTGLSGITLDISKVQILIIDFEWLGVGVVRVGFVIDGVIYYVHQFTHANIITSVYMQTPNLPVRWEVRNTADNTGGEVEQICCSVISEGGQQDAGISRSADRGATAIAASGANIYQLVGIRLKAASIRHAVEPQTISVSSTTAGADARWALILNPTFTGGAAASWVSVTNSPIEYDISRTGTISGGIQVASGYLSDAAEQVQATLGRIVVAANFDGSTPDELILAVQRIAGGGSDSFFGSIQWQETT